MCSLVHIYLFYFHFDACEEWLVRKVLPYRNKCCALDPCSRSPLQSRLKLYSPLLLFFPAPFLNNFHDNADSKAQKQQQMTKRANKTPFCGKSPWSKRTDKRESSELSMPTPDEFCSKFDVNNNTTRAALGVLQTSQRSALISALSERASISRQTEKNREEWGMPLLLTPLAHTRSPFRMTLLSQGICMQSELLIRATEGVISSARERSRCKTPPLGEIAPIRTNEPLHRISDGVNRKLF